MPNESPSFLQDISGRGAMVTLITSLWLSESSNPHPNLIYYHLPIFIVPLPTAVVVHNASSRSEDRHLRRVEKHLILNREITINTICSLELFHTYTLEPFITLSTSFSQRIPQTLLFFRQSSFV